MNAVNAMFCSTLGERRLFLDPRCDELRKDLQQVAWKADIAGNIDKSDRRRTQVSDELGYRVQEEFAWHGFAGFRQERILCGWDQISAGSNVEQRVVGQRGKLRWDRLLFAFILRGGPTLDLLVWGT